MGRLKRCGTWTSSTCHPLTQQTSCTEHATLIICTARVCGWGGELTCLWCAAKAARSPFSWSTASSRLSNCCCKPESFAAKAACREVSLACAWNHQHAHSDTVRAATNKDNRKQRCLGAVLYSVNVEVDLGLYNSLCWELPTCELCYFTQKAVMILQHKSESPAMPEKRHNMWQN